MITLYSTNCPKCKVLEKKLDQANIAYSLNTTFNVEDIIARGFEEVPLLEVNGELLKFTEAVNWINNQERGTN